MQIVAEGIVSKSEPGTERATLTFPTVTALSNESMLATWRSGSTKDCDDNAVEFSVSEDHGETWGAPFRPFEAPTTVRGKRGSIGVCYLTEHEPARLLAAMMWVDRESYPGKGIFNPETEGCLPMAILLAESEDLGRTWSPFWEVPMPEEIGPPSLTNPILVMKDGSLGLSIESNKTYHDASKWYQRVVLFHSTDKGRSWGAPVIAGFDPTGRIYNWDQRVGVGPDGRVAAHLWTYDTEAQTYLNIHRRISADSGHTWSEAEDLGFTDQASHPAMLPDGRVVLAWVDRFGSGSIRARLAGAIDGSFDPGSELIIYDHAGATESNEDSAGALGLSVWSYGLPYAEALSNGDVLVVYYAGSEKAMDVRYARIRVD
jgi:hypothetical protein